MYTTSANWNSTLNTTVPTTAHLSHEENTTTNLYSNFTFPSTSTSWNVTTNSTTVADEQDLDGKSLCNGWLDAQHAVFQLANLCILISLLTPSNFKHHCFFLRVMLNFGYLLTVVWSALFICMPDILTWNTAFLVLNSIHLIYLGCKIVPERFSKALEDVYAHTFKPLKVTRKQFKELTDFGSMLLLAKGSVYAKQGLNTTGQKLSMLLKGRLKVTYEDVYLHSIDANEFVDSPEYDCVVETGNQETFQVTISASEDSLLFSWPHKRLKGHLSTEPLFEHIFDQIIGQDISHKLYEIQERQMYDHQIVCTEAMATRRSSMVNVRHSIVSSSATNLNKLSCLQEHQLWSVSA